MIEIIFYQGGSFNLELHSEYLSFSGQGKRRSDSFIFLLSTISSAGMPFKYIPSLLFSRPNGFGERLSRSFPKSRDQADTA
jgi:hypothetical protein